MTDKPQTTIEDEKKIVVAFSTGSYKPRNKRMTKADRLDFIAWLFDNYDTFDHSKTRWNLAKEIVETYKQDHALQLSIEWVNMLFKFGICKYSDGTYGFKENVEYTIDDVCDNPTIYRSIN